MLGEGFRIIDKRHKAGKGGGSSSFTERVGIKLQNPKVVPSALDGLDGVPSWLRRVPKKNITK